MSSSSLEQFFLENVRTRLPEKELKILELGSGPSSVFKNISDKSYKVIAIDKDEKLINQARGDDHISYLPLDISSVDIVKNLNTDFDLIFDAHCFQCITDKNERIRAWKNVFNLLASKGIFAAEMMVQPTKNKLNVSSRFIPESLVLEQEILNAGLKINFFFISRDLIFDLNEEHDLKCDLVRLIAQK